MLSFTQTVHSVQPNYGTLTLTYDQRTKSRQKVTLDNGREAGLFLTRGLILQQGDMLQAETGEVVEVLVAKESVSSVYVNDPLTIARTCYHLGNRHVPLQITAGFIRYQHDHVLDDMVRGLGLAVAVEKAAFEPEAGAYGGHSHAHSSHEH